MKTMIKYISIPVILLLVLPVLLLSGCGGEDVAKSAGCPSGSYLANSGDIITVPADETLDAVLSTAGAPAPAGVVGLMVAVTVTDKDSIPRNNVCIRVYTGGSYLPVIWYSDDTYATTVTGAGPMNGINVVTNDVGVANLFFDLPYPAANFATATTAGVDIEGDTWISFNSGSVSGKWTASWTVKGEPL